MNGLNNNEVLELQKKYGKNELIKEKKELLIIKLIKILCEPTFLLLIGACIVYLVLGETTDAIVMLVSIVGILFIDIFQEIRTDRTLKALKQLSTPVIKVIRQGVEVEILSTDLVPGDLMLIYEGIKIPADGFIINQTNIKIDESSLTGEAELVSKKIYNCEKSENYFRDDYCYAGTLVIQGTAIVKVDKIGLSTEYGKIGKNLSEVEEVKSQLQNQTASLIKRITFMAFVLMIVVFIVNFIKLNNFNLHYRIVKSLLSSITLSMCLIPEEYPVVLTIFLSLGAWRLAKKKSLVRKMNKIETLGSISVLCVDKTGTITKNEMTVVSSWSVNGKNNDLYETMGMCCNDVTYDPMELAMIDICNKNSIDTKHLFSGKKIKDYPFSNETKMMGTAWLHEGLYIMTAKGSIDSIKKICNLNKVEEEIIETEKEKMTSKGLRVIAIAKKVLNDKKMIKENLEDYELEFRGIVGLMDPPKEGIKKNISICNNAGIRIIMITGDDGKTASSIAKEIGILNNDSFITGNMISKMTDEELQEAVKINNIFSRVIPEHKYRIVKALQKNNEVVAMTGDGVNDAIALKQADIGIAMGKRGSDVSKEASDLILLDDNFNTIVDTIKDGRRIYDNIKRAISYLLVIHIPIALISLFNPILNLPQEWILIYPIHVVLFEFVVDPTSSIVLERIKASKNIMNKKPREKNENILNKKVFFKIIVQGLAIFLASFITYLVCYINNMDNYTARTMAFLIIIYSNMFIVFVNSCDDLVIKNLKNILSDKVILISTLLVIFISLIIIYCPFNSFFKFTDLTLRQYLITILISFVSVFWYEIVKIIKAQD